MKVRILGYKDRITLEKDWTFTLPYRTYSDHLAKAFGVPYLKPHTVWDSVNQTSNYRPGTTSPITFPAGTVFEVQKLDTVYENRSHRTARLKVLSCPLPKIGRKLFYVYADDLEQMELVDPDAPPPAKTAASLGYDPNEGED
jgi:hypothetical protein